MTGFVPAGMQENVDLGSRNTFGIHARARYFCAVHTLQELRVALQFRRVKKLPLLVLGGGSNVLLCSDYPGVVVQIALHGIELLTGTGDEQGDPQGSELLVRAAAGENWHEFVQHCLHKGYHGLENLALIPGSVGAAPIQNIGAYGVEIQEWLSAVTVLDINTGEVETLSSAQCEFGYRDSVFKGRLRGRKIVLDVTFRLHRHAQVNLSYAALAQALSGLTDPQPADVFNAVCAIRRSKLPDPAVLGNAGSFFKNPVIPRLQYDALVRIHAELPSYPVQDKAGQPSAVMVKVPAAWLIEKAGWKGRICGQAAVYQQQPLVLVNRGGATAAEIVTLARQIMEAVERLFDIRLEPEVQWIPAEPPG
ncbi:MAG: UDP-N-acetylmuramate dehydrogenase [Pseudomonadota bacterium]